MDSRLLNAFHDDPFDGNYVKYDTDTHFWSNDSGSLGLQLAETLHGILPIAPTDVASNNLFSSSSLKEGDYSLESKNYSNTNSIMFENYEEGMQNMGQQTIEVVSVDPNHDFDSDCLESTDDEDDDDEDDDDVDEGNNEDIGSRGIVAFNDVRSCSRSTFRSRTDSSSIGDYESHSSDYDDDSDSMEPLDDCALHSDGNAFKKPTDDVDPFAMQLDVSTFDLAAFITQDDQIFDNHTPALVPNAGHNIKLQKTVEPTIPLDSDSDSDSDVIVDVETVEETGIGLCDQRKQMESLNNLNSSNCDAEKKETKPTEPNFTRNFTIVPNKVQSVILKRKFGIGRGKNLNMHRNPTKAMPKSKLKQVNNNNLKNNNVEEKTEKSCVQNKVIPLTKNKVENNPTEKQQVTPIKIKLEKPYTHEKVIEQKQIPSQIYKCTNFVKKETVSIKTEPKEDEQDYDKEIVENSEVQTLEAMPMKRKLNLEEYKKRRENPSLQPSICKNLHMQNKKVKTEVSQGQTTMAAVTNPQPKCPIKKPPQTEAVTSIVKSLKESQPPKGFVDPITEAKNKVLRLQELKKAQQIKIIDSTVSSKVARVTKLLPLKEIVKGSYKTGNRAGPGINNSEYEEIIIVSAGCNTDITIPPNGYNTSKSSSRSLLKSNVLFAKISNSFQKVRSDDSVKISSNSLIVSIQDVVVKKTSPLPIEGQQTTTTTSEHGEDKIIMHLRKDRIRKRNFSQSTQTELLPEFPLLPLPQVQSSSDRFNSSAGRGTKVRRRYRARQSSFSSDEEDSNYRSQGNSSKRRSRSKYTRRHRSSISSSYSESDDYSKRNHRHSGTSAGRSISSSERRSRSKSFDRIYNRSSRSRSKSSSRRAAERNVSAPVEERRIVYVGRIGQDTTKEMLRRKFIVYGPIKQITIHYKDTGMKYGFVTFEKSEDAFRVIDSGPKDETINMYDISFGGRRAFCRASYADLDNAGMNMYQSYDVPRQVAPSKQEDSFEALLLKMKAKLNATKSSVSSVKT
ncbi:uncharacterized protein LOC129908483 [Episyrphus balteatus]|uniref:uncharacterized protein LOC129908483 n=1 Tax=Episyrphus balteatus TaxID=286459 RepID=UPI00248609BB|nr:uncharacterized protein LOC129908483 [Episyrphus balteatus]